MCIFARRNDKHTYDKHDSGTRGTALGRALRAEHLTMT